MLEVREPSAKYLVEVEPALTRGFAVIAAAPNGVSKLRELILEFAVGGSLVPQCEGDAPASHLLANARVQRGLQTQGKRSSGRAQSEPPRDALPRGWSWSSLSAIGLISPRNEATGDTIASFVQMSSIPAAMTGAHATEPRPWRDIKSGFTQFADGDVGVAKITPCFENGKSTVFRNLANGIGAGTTELHIVRPLGGVLPEYVLAFVKSPSFLRKGETVMTGSAGQKRLPRAYFESAPFPLPPLAEQHRIVARVEELMKLCDALERGGRLADEQHVRLTSTLFNALAASESAHALAENWQRIAEHFDLLLDRPEAIDALERAVFQLAVRGLLVPQDVGDKPARLLLEQIRSDKAVIAPTASGRWAQTASLVTKEEERFELPRSWTWARLNDLSIAIVDCPHSTPKFVKAGVLCIDTNSFKGGGLLPHKLRYVDAATYAERVVRLVPRPGDMVFAREGTVGESLIIPSDTVSCLGQRVMLFRFSAHVFNEYIRMTISSSDFLAHLLEMHKGIGAKHVNVGDMRCAAVPLPPLAEQRRIVARVEELCRLCAQLRERLTDARNTQIQLADALVAEVG